MSFAPVVNPAVHDLGKQPQHTTLLSVPLVSPLQIPRKNETLWNNLQLRWILHIVPFSLSHSLPFSSISANRPKGGISAVSQVSAQALWKGRALLNEPVVGEVRGVCVSLVNRALWDVTV